MAEIVHDLVFVGDRVDGPEPSELFPFPETDDKDGEDEGQGDPTELFSEYGLVPLSGSGRKHHAGEGKAILTQGKAAR